MVQVRDAVRHRACGIVASLVAASLIGVVLAVVVVQGWTLHVVALSEERAAQRRLDVNLAVLEHELRRLGTDWTLGPDGSLMSEGSPVEGLQTAVRETARITRAVATVFAGDTRVATTVVGADGKPAVGTKLAPGPAFEAVVTRGTAYRGVADILGVQHLTVYEPLVGRDGRQVGILFVGVPSAEIGELRREVVRQSSWAALGIVIVVVTGIALLMRAMLRPLRALAGAVRMIGEGLYGVEVPCAGRGDQLGEIGRAVEALRVKAMQARLLDEQASVARAASVRRQHVIEQLTQDFGASVSGVLAGLVGSAETMRGSAADMAREVERTLGEMAASTSDAERSSENLSLVASAAGQLTENVGEISRRVGEADRAAREAVEQARATDATMRRLSEAAGRIDHVVALISRVAAQTNLLALNASIEAARAGEAGRGFAVVAGEVKLLAAQTSEATRQIGLQIGEIQAATSRAVDATTVVTAAIGRVSTVATMIASAVEQQGVATREIATQVQAVAEATGRASLAMQRVSLAADRSSHTSQTVLGSADLITRTSNDLRDDVDHFVAAMRQSQESDDRRRYERIPGNGAEAWLRSAAHGTSTAAIVDIALGGAAFGCAWPCAAGAEIMVGLPGAGAEVAARVVTVRDGVLAVAFRQDEATLAHLGRALDALPHAPHAPHVAHAPHAAHAANAAHAPHAPHAAHAAHAAEAALAA